MSFVLRCKSFRVTVARKNIEEEKLKAFLVPPSDLPTLYQTKVKTFRWIEAYEKTSNFARKLPQLTRKLEPSISITWRFYVKSPYFVHFNSLIVNTQDYVVFVSFLQNFMSLFINSILWWLLTLELSFHFIFVFLKWTEVSFRVKFNYPKITRFRIL